MSEPIEHSTPVVDTPTELSVFQLISSHVRFILVFTLIGTALVGGYSLIMRHTYQSNAKIIANESKSSAISSLLGGIPSFIPGSGGGNSALSMGEILGSRTNAEYIIKKCKLDSIEPFRALPHTDLVTTVQDILNVDARRLSGVIVIETSMQTSPFPNSDEQHHIAELCAQVCNAAIEGLDVANREKSTSTAHKTRIYIERVLASNKIKLDSLQHAMIDYQSEHHIFTPEKQAEAMVSSGIGIGVELAKAETELRLAKEQFQNNTPMIAALESKVAGLRNQYLSVQNGGLVNTDRLSIPLDVLPDVSMGYLNLVRDVKILEQVNAYLESQRMQEAIQEERDVPTIQVIDPAIPVYKRSSPARGIMVLVGAVVSALLSVVYLVGRRAFTGVRAMLTKSASV